MVSPGSKPESVLKTLRMGDRSLILLDYDGTLVPIARTPHLAAPPTPLLTLLRRLVCSSRLQVGIVSGRTVMDLQRILPVPGLWFVGQHGAELVSPTGECLNPPQVDGAKNAILGLTARIEADLPESSGAWLENKGYSLALHYRLASRRDADFASRRFLTHAERFLSSGAFTLKNGKKVLEILPREVNKGSASRALTHFTGIPLECVLYAGDDETDEDAFRALPSSITVLVSAVERRSSARHRFSSHHDVLALLQALSIESRQGAAAFTYERRNEYHQRGSRGPA